jgi:hypothetical protein
VVVSLEVLDLLQAQVVFLNGAFQLVEVPIGKFVFGGDEADGDHSMGRRQVDVLQATETSAL